jgi:hypothetical protein
MRLTRSNIYHFCLLPLIVPFSGSCKQRQPVSADVKGVENLAKVENESDPSPVCGDDSFLNPNEAVLRRWLDRPGTMRELNARDQSYSDIQRTDYRAVALRTALSRIAPTLIQQLHSLNTKVSFTTSVPDACSKLDEREIFESHLKRQYFSCVVKKPGQRSPEIFFGSISSPQDLAKALTKYGLKGDEFTADTFVIRTEAVRAVSVAYAKVSRQLLEKWSANIEQAKTKKQRVPADISNLAALIEMNRKDKAFLVNQVFSDLKSSAHFKPDAADSLKQLQIASASTDPDWFNDYVMVEVLDSHYCSPKSRSHLQKFFPKANAAFVSKFVDGGLEQ